MSAELAALRAENEQLRERIAWFEASLGAGYIPPPHWRLTPMEARLLGTLLARELLTPEAAMAALYGDRQGDEPHAKIILVFIHKLRAKLRPHGIRIWTNWGYGYYLTAAGKDAVRTKAAAPYVEVRGRAA